MAAVAEVSEFGDEVVQLKMLQTILTTLTSPHFFMEEELVASLLRVCFLLHRNRSPMIHHTADATIRQVVDLLFDRLSSAYFFILVSTPWSFSKSGLPACLT